MTRNNYSAGDSQNISEQINTVKNERQNLKIGQKPCIKIPPTNYYNQTTLSLVQLKVVWLRFNIESYFVSKLNVVVQETIIKF